MNAPAPRRPRGRPCAIRPPLQAEVRVLADARPVAAADIARQLGAWLADRLVAEGLHRG